MKPLDPLDARILLALEEDADRTVLDLARTLGVARNTVQARLARMRRDGVLRGFGQRVDPAALGRPLTAFVAVSIAQHARAETSAALAEVPEVVEIHATTGDADLLVRVVARDTADLHRITTSLVEQPGIVRTNTVVSLAEELPRRIAPLLTRLAGGGDG